MASPRRNVAGPEAVRIPGRGASDRASWPGDMKGGLCFINTSLLDKHLVVVS